MSKRKSKESYVLIVAEIFLAARGWGETVCANSPLTCNLYELWSWPAHKISYEEMIGLAVKSLYEEDG